ncbi:MAG: hypothetical protein ABL974_02215 [Prosthecobacter sp.]
MSLAALKELSALDAEVKLLRSRYDDHLLDTRRRFLNQVVEYFSRLMEAEDFKVKRDPVGATARLDETELAVICTDPVNTLVDSQAKYSVTCSLAPNLAYGIMLCRQPLGEFTNQSSDTNDQITNKKLEISYLKALIENQSLDTWFVIGRLENTSEIRGSTGPLPTLETFSTLEQAVMTALREISTAAIAPRA